MTNREYLVAVKAILAECGAESLVKETESKISALDTKNSAKAKATAEKKAKENAPVYQAVEAYLAEGEATLADISKVTGYHTSKIFGLAKAKIESGEWVSKKIKVKGKGEATVLALAPTAEAEVEA